MSKKSENDALAVLAGLSLLGLGIAGFTALSSARERQQFTEELSRELGQYGYGFVSCDMGRTAAQEVVWKVTLRHPRRGILSLEAGFPPDVSPYAEQTRLQLLQRIVRALQPEALAWTSGNT